MIIPYFEELEQTETIQPISYNNIYIDHIYPAYFTPDGNLIRIITDHMQAHFLDDINECNNYISFKSNSSDQENKLNYPFKTLITKENGYEMVNGIWLLDQDAIQDIDRDIIYILKKKLDSLTKRFYEIKKNNCINMYDISSYYHLPMKPVIYNIRGDLEDYSGTYSEEARNTIKNLIKSKIYIYNYYLNSCLNYKNPQFISKNNIDPVDFLIGVIGFDKIERQVKKEITTTKYNINEAFFNYLIMDYKIRQIPKYIFDIETNKFILENNNDFSYHNINNKEREYSEEIELIKRKVLFEKRNQYFK